MKSSGWYVTLDASIIWLTSSNMVVHKPLPNCTDISDPCQTRRFLPNSCVFPTAFQQSYVKMALCRWQALR